MNLPSYQEIKNILSHSQLITPAELHGMVCGYICAGITHFDSRNDNFSTMLMLISAENDNKEINLLLNALFTYTQTKIQQFDMDFNLLLPAEDADLMERAMEFGKWCEGFLTGMHLPDAPPVYRDQDEVNDILKKLAEVAKLQFYQLEYSEEDEFFLMEVTEFVRLSVFTIYQELPTAQGGNFENTAHTLH